MPEKSFSFSYSLTLPAESELRAFMPFLTMHYTKAENFAHVACSLDLEGSEGDAEIFGCAVIYRSPVYLSYGDSVSIYTKKGATFRVCLANEKLKRFIYVSSNTNYRHIVELHASLNSERWKGMSSHPSADSNTVNPPVLLVLGKPFSGKNAVSTTLLNYACRDGWFPLLVDLDVRSPISGAVGTVSVISWDCCCPFDELMSIAGSHRGITLPYGHFSHKENPKGFLETINDVCSILKSHRNGDLNEKTKRSGTIINTPSELNFQEIVYIIEVLKVSHVVVLQDDNLRISLEHYYHLSKDGQLVNETNTKVIQGMTASTGVVRINSRSQTLQSITRYMYGGGKIDISPILHHLPSKDIRIYRSREDLKLEKHHTLAHLRSTDASFLENSVCMILRGLFDEESAQKCIFAIGVIKEIDSEGMKVLLPNLYPIPPLDSSRAASQPTVDEFSHSRYQRESIRNKGTLVQSSFKNSLFVKPVSQPPIKSIHPAKVRLDVLVTPMKYAHYH